MTAAILTVIAAGVLCGCAVATMRACLRIWPDSDHAEGE